MSIDKIYKEAFAGDRVEASDLSWLELESKLDKISFLKFTLSKFNIFYAGLIAGTFVVSSAIGIDYFVVNKTNTEQNEQEQLQEELPVVSAINDTATTILTNTVSVDKNVDEPVKTIVEARTENQKENSQALTNINAENTSLEVIIDEKTNANSIVEEPLFNTEAVDINDVEASVAGEKQKIIVIQQPKVIVRDTVYENKQSGRKVKKKP